jgi:hypothetical protein
MTNLRFGIWSLLLAGLLVLFAVGCSGDGSGSPTLPSEGSGLPAAQGASAAPMPASDGHGTWGNYMMVVNEETMTIDIVPNRSADAHYDVSWVKQFCPTCISAVVKSFDPNTRTFKIELHTKNPTSKTGRDVRFIVDLDGTGEYDMLDPDNYTKLHDIAGNVNPFRALAKSAVGRAFIPGSNDVSLFSLYISASHTPVTNIPFLIDVSYPNRCLEPYMMSDIKITGQFPPGGGGSVTVSLTSWDSAKIWGKVFLRTGGIFTPADIEMTAGATTGVDGKKFTATFSNTVGAQSGLVPILIEAYNNDLVAEPMPLNDYARIYADPGAASAIAGEVFNALTKQAANTTAVTIHNTGGGPDPLVYNVTDGTYFVPVLAGSYNVKAVHSLYFLQDTIYDVVVPSGKTVYVCFGLAPKYLSNPADAIASISGHIRDANTGDPIMGAQATLDNAGLGGVIQARTTDAHGHFCFWAVPTYQAQSWTVHAFHPDYIPQDKDNIPSAANKATPQVDFDLQPVGNPPLWEETFEAGPSNVGTQHDWTFSRVATGWWPGGSGVTTYHNSPQSGDALWHVQDPSTNPVQDIFYINGTCTLPPDDTLNGFIPAAFEGHRYMWYGEALDNTPPEYTHSGSFIDEWNGSVGNGGTSSNGSNAGTAKTGPIDLSGHTELTLSLQSFWEIEAVDPSIMYDAMDVLISKDGNAWDRLDRLNPLAEPIPDSGNAMKPYTSSGYNMNASWSPSLIDISAYGGNKTIYLRFDFDTIDPLYNGFKGWIIDNIVIWPYKL